MLAPLMQRSEQQAEGLDQRGQTDPVRHRRADFCHEAGPRRSHVITGRRILVVEDEPAIRSLVAAILVAQGYDVDEAGDGLEALRCLDERTYDLIVSDMVMPGLDGPGLYHELQRRAPESPLRLLFVSGSSSASAYAEFLATAKVPVLEKP